MSESSNLIEQAEALAGCRWDDPDNPNAMHALMGAMARALGTNPHGPRDDVAEAEQTPALLSSDVALIVRCARIEKNTLFMPPGRLSGRLYRQSHVELARLGGVWNYHANSYTFPADPAEIFAVARSSV